MISSYLEKLKILDIGKSNQTGLRVLDLFAGSGGMALGFESAGYETLGIEIKSDAVKTYNRNLSGTCIEAALDKNSEFPEADIVIGGPPCQPFSVGGLQLGLSDTRDGFPAFIKAVKDLRPRLWMFENVRGMLYRNRDYLSEIISTLSEMNYTVDAKLLRASDYGVPQNRERLFVVGHLGGYEFPTRLDQKFTAGDAISDIAFNINDDDEFLTPNQDAYVAKYERASKCINPRDLHFDRPARTLTCRNLAGATGDMHRIKLPDGRRKRVNVREASRLQSFPDWFQFFGEKSSQFYQIGNAVPPLMAYYLALSVRDYLEGTNTVTKKEQQLRML